MAEFSKAYNKTLAFEGRYVNDPNDRGGETYKGVARNLHPNWPGWNIIDQFRKDKIEELNRILDSNERLQELVEEFYKSTFWDKARLDEIDNQAVADKIYDIGVNQGMKSAVKYFQEVLNMLNNDQKHYSNIKVDGDLGPKTLKAYNQYMATAARFGYRSEEKNEKVLLKALAGEQYARYKNIVKRTENQERFFYGWLLNRL